MAKLKLSGLRARSGNGLSLIEACIAIAIMALIFANLAFIFNQGYFFLRKTRLNRLAFFLAQEKMEALLHQNTTDRPADYNETKAAVGAPYEIFQREVNITRPVPASIASSWCGGSGCGNGLALVNVTVYWQGTGAEQSFSLVSLVSNASH